MSAASRIDLCNTADVTPGNAIRVWKAGLVLTLFNLAQLDLFAYGLRYF